MLEVTPTTSPRHRPWDPASYVDLIDELESRGTGFCGVIAFRGPSKVEGTVYLEGGRLCWAAARGMRRRMTDLLIERSEGALSPKRLKEIFEHCQHNRVPLGETLVDLGLVSPAGLRLALRQQATESLMYLSALSGLRSHTLDRGPESYSPRFTFEFLDLVSSAHHIASASRWELAEDALTGAIPDDSFGAAFVWPRDSVDQLPVASVGTRDRTVSTVMDLGRWGHQQLELAGAIGGSTRSFTAMGEHGEGIVVWRGDEGFCVACCHDLRTVARLLSNLHRSHIN